MEQIEHGHHIFRAYWKNAFVKQYEKFSTFLRNELCSNNLTDFGLKKGLDHLAERAREVPTHHGPLRRLSRRNASTFMWTFLCCRRIALPIAVGSERYPGIKIHDTRMIRLMEVLLHGGTTSAAGPLSKSIKPSSPLSASPGHPTA